MSKPITPDEVVQHKRVTIPDQVFDVFNEAIARHWNGVLASFTQKEIQEELAKRLALSVNEVISRHYLDVEPIYREAGWLVRFDQPGYNEDPYPATFKFSLPS